MLSTRVVKMLEISGGTGRLLVPLATELEDGIRFKLEAAIGRSVTNEEWRDLARIHESWRRSFVTDTYEKRVQRLMKGEADEHDAK